MSIISWLKNKFSKKRKLPEGQVKNSKKPLREFVYLDEVSLRSLLSSQKGEMVDSTSERVADSFDSEIGAAIGTGSNPLVKSELTSRFQTSNSRAIQTSRKATVQSWFGDFLKIPNIRLIKLNSKVPKVVDVKELLSISDSSVVIKSKELIRGELVEFSVKLAADPIFRLGTMVTEFTGMAEDFPELFGPSGASSSLKEAQPVNKILQRLLAGLIPVRAEALDYTVVTIEDVEYVVHKDTLHGLALEGKPLEIVGVTEHLAYWKDIRRVLFSDAEFIVMGRISRSALHRSWMPVKLVDLFSELTPDLVEQISNASLMPFNENQLTNESDSNETRLGVALTLYKEAILKEAKKPLSMVEETLVGNKIIDLRFRANTASDQRSAFWVISKMLSDFAKVQLKPSRDRELRAEARSSSGLSLFPSIPHETPVANESQPTNNNETDARLLDVEIVAIYW